MLRIAARRADLLCFGGLLLLLLALLLPYDRLPMLMVDESRNAVNALGIATDGHWLVPYFNGHPDHWNTKPPLLIWMIAGLLRLGAPPLLALRLPSLLAAAATLGMVWWFCRHHLENRLAAIIGGLILLTSSLYMGPHVARSGDYDSLLCAFILGQALTLFLAIADPRRLHVIPFALCAACVAGAILTKAVAGGLLLPGLLAYTIVSFRLPLLFRDWRAWALVVAAMAVVAAYYLLRAHDDPGYLQAVWQNELGGRFGDAQDRHVGGPFYYLADLIRRFEPGMLLLPCVVFALFSGDARHRAAATLCLITSLIFLLVITASATKLYWYSAPIVPLLSIAAGLGTADALAWLARHRRAALPLSPQMAGAALFGLLLTAAALCVLRNQAWSVQGLRTANNGQFWYGSFLDRLRASRAAQNVTVVDGGLPNQAGFVNYDPMLQFYANWESRRGLPVTIRPTGTQLAAGTPVATCDPAALAWLRDHEHLVVTAQQDACVFGHAETRENRPG